MPLPHDSPDDLTPCARTLWDADESERGGIHALSWEFATAEQRGDYHKEARACLLASPLLAEAINALTHAISNCACPCGDCLYCVASGKLIARYADLQKDRTDDG